MRQSVLLTGLGAALTTSLSIAAKAEPIDDVLVIDGETAIITRATAPHGHPFDEVLSGWLYRMPETRALEADSFQNPGMLAVELGEEIWNTVEGSEGRSCATCHGDAGESMKGVGARFPKWNADSGRPVNIELQINECRTERMGAEPYRFDKGGQKPLTAYIKHQSIGIPVGLDLSEGEMRSWWKIGEELYHRRTGQLNFSCDSCHGLYNGLRIRADHLSQGQANGFPTYRLKQAALVSLHDRFRGCIRDTRAEIPPAFSDELMALEVYVTWRGTGLSVETPAVRQ